MEFLETIEGYLATKNEENRNVYVPRIYSFATFLQEEKNVTDKNYMYMYKNYVSNVIGKRRIGSIKYSDIKKFYNSLILEKKFKPNSMEIINTILHPVFTMAVRDGYIRTNPSDGVMAEIKKSHNWEKPKRHALTEEQ